MSSSSSTTTSTVPSTSMAFVSRVVDVLVPSRQTPEGMGAMVRRSIGGPYLRNFDPFLLLDHASIEAGAGFPDHPHRGFETVSYNLPHSKGYMVHEDFTGKRGDLKPGDVQWMTAGRGILHSEIPVGGPVEGLQLWVNLSKKEKMTKPEYQDLRAKDIPAVTRDGVTAHIIAGEAFGVKAATRTRTPTHYIHFDLDARAQLEQPIPAGWNALLYVLRGNIDVADNAEGKVERYQTATLKLPKGTGGAAGVRIRAGTEGASVIFLAGQPLNEPIVQHGPFVMNTQEEIHRAMIDFQMGRNGFEKAVGWKSDIGTKFRNEQMQKRKGNKGRFDDEDDDL